MSIVTDRNALKSLILGLIPDNVLGDVSPLDVRESVGLTIDGAWDRIDAIEVSAVLGYPLFTDAATGIAGTSSGETFSTAVGSYMQLYRNDAGVATLLAELPLRSAVDAAVTDVVKETDTTTAPMDFVVDEDTMVSDSDTKVPTQQSVKAYVDAAAADVVKETDTTTAPMGFVVDEDTMVSDSATKVPTQQSVKAYVDANGGGGGGGFATHKYTFAEDFSFLSGLVAEEISSVAVNAADVTGGKIEVVVDGVSERSVLPGAQFDGLFTPSVSMSINSVGTAYDVSVGALTGIALSVAGQETNPFCMLYNDDGTKLYMVGQFGDDINEYALGTAHDISTATFTGIALSVAAQEITPTCMIFNNDGTKLYVLGTTGQDINEYTLGTAYDISTGVFASVALSVAAQEAFPTCMIFNNDGTKLYVLGTTGDDINEYALGTAYDIATGIAFGIALSVAAQELSPTCMIFNNDGTKLYVLGTAGDEINEYVLGTAFNISTGVFLGIALDVSAQDVFPTCMIFNDDGGALYVLGQTGQDITEYALGSAYGGTGYVAVGAGAAAAVGPPGADGAGAVDSVNAQTGVVVLDADDLSDATTVNKFTTAAEAAKLAGISTGATLGVTTQDEGVAVDATATTLNFVGAGVVATDAGSGVTTVTVAGGGGGAVDSVNAQTGVVVLDADDLSDAATVNKFTTAADVAKLAGIEALADVTDAANVDAAGAVMEADTSTASMGFVVDEDNMASDSATKIPTQQSVKAYVDASESAYLTHKYIAAEDHSFLAGLAAETISSVAVNALSVSSGTMEVVVDGVTEKTVLAGAEFDGLFAPSTSLSVNAAGSGLYDISAGVFASIALSVGAQENIPFCMIYNDDGTKLYVLGYSGADINEYALGTAYDISAGVFASIALSVGAQETSPTCMIFNDDGTKLYVMGNTGDDINEYTLGTAYDISTGVFASIALSVGAQETGPTCMIFNNDGTKLYVMGTTGDDINEYALGTAYDISTGTFASIALSVGAQETIPSCMIFNDDGTKLYVMGYTGDDINEYTVGTAYAGTGYAAIGIGSSATVSGAVDSVNAQTGVVVLDADDISDAATTNKFTTAADVAKLAGITTGATLGVATQDEGVAVDADATTLNFVGAGVVATDAGSGVTTVTVAGGGSGVTTQDEGVVVDATATTLNFVGAGVVATDAGAGVTTVTVSGGGAAMTDSEVKIAYENNADTNEFSDAEETKLSGIEAAADVTDAANVAAAGALMTTGGTMTGAISESTGTAFFSNGVNPIPVHGMSGRVMIGAGHDHNGATDGNVTGGTWLQSFVSAGLVSPVVVYDYIEDQSHMVVSNDGRGALAAVSRTNDTVAGSTQAFKASAIGYDTVGKKPTAGYFDSIRAKAGSGGVIGVEIQTATLNGPVADTTPYLNDNNFARNMILGAGADAVAHGKSYAVSEAIYVAYNGAKFHKGIVFRNTALLRDDEIDDQIHTGGSGYARALTMAHNHGLSWWSLDPATTPGTQEEVVQITSAVEDSAVKWHMTFTDGSFVIGDRVGAQYNAFSVLYDANTAAGIVVTPAAVGGKPQLTVNGANTNIDLELTGKGTGYTRVDGALNFKPTATVPPAIEGSAYYDSTLNDIMVHKGAGYVAIGVGAGSGDDTQTYIEANREHEIGLNAAGDTVAKLNLYTLAGDPLGTGTASIVRYPGLNNNLVIENSGNGGFALSGGGDFTWNAKTVMHAGKAVGSIVTSALCKNNSGATLDFGNTTAGANLDPCNSTGANVSATVLTGTWICEGYALNGQVTQFRRIS